MAGGRWLKFVHATADIQKDLGAFLRYFTALSRGHASWMDWCSEEPSACVLPRRCFYMQRNPICAL
jgi:hypothetical protein